MVHDRFVHHSVSTSIGETFRLTRNKLFIIGLDGMPFDLLSQNTNEFKNIKAVIDRGSFSTLRSTIPYSSPTAWASFITGCNPGQHGILDFLARDSRDPSTSRTPVNASNIRKPSLWKELSDHGIRVGAFGLPMTYPPEKVNGFIIGGFPLPRTANDYVYPPELYKTLTVRGWDFADLPTQAYSKKHLQEFLTQLYSRIRSKTDATLFLMESYAWDLFVVHYFETDKLFHDFLNFRNPEFCSREDHLKYGKVVDEFLIELDRQIGELLAALPHGSNVMIVSDHGFRECKRVIHVDTWLLNHGYLQLKKGLKHSFKHWLFRRGLTPETIIRILPESLAQQMKKGEEEHYYTESSPKRTLSQKVRRLANRTFLNTNDDVDWVKSSAFNIGSSGVLSIVVKSSQPEERDQILGQLEKDIPDIEDSKFANHPLFDELYRSEQLYGSSTLPDVPDLVGVNSTARYTVMPSAGAFLSNKVVCDNYVYSYRAGHARNGIIVAAGPEMEAGIDLGPVDIVDVFPTILHFFACPVPSDVDGRVVKSMFRRGSTAYMSEIVFSQERTVRPSAAKALSRSEEEEVKEHLRRMGYI